MSTAASVLPLADSSFLKTTRVVGSQQEGERIVSLHDFLPWPEFPSK